MLRNPKMSFSKRILRVETLENRELLSVNPLGLDTFQPENTPDYTVSPTFNVETDTAVIAYFSVMGGANGKSNEFELQVNFENNSGFPPPNIYYTLCDEDNPPTNGAESIWIKYTEKTDWQTPEQHGGGDDYVAVIAIDPQSFEQEEDCADILVYGKSIAFLVTYKTDISSINEDDTAISQTYIGPYYTEDTENIDTFVAQLDDEPFKVDLMVSLKKSADELDITEKCWQLYDIYYYIGETESKDAANWKILGTLDFPRDVKDLNDGTEIVNTGDFEVTNNGTHLAFDLSRIVGMNVSGNIFFRIGSDAQQGQYRNLKTLEGTKAASAPVAYDLSEYLLELPAKSTDSLAYVSGITTNSATLTWTKPTIYYPNSGDPITKIQVQAKNDANQTTGYFVTVYNIFGTVLPSYEYSHLIGTGTGTTATLHLGTTNTGGADQQFFYVVEAVLLDSDKKPFNNGLRVVVASGTVRTLQENQIAQEIPVAPPTNVKTVYNKTANTVTVTWKAPANYNDGYGITFLEYGTAISMGGHYITKKLPAGSKSLSVTIPIGTDALTSLKADTRYSVWVNADKSSAIRTYTYVETGLNVAEPLPSFQKIGSSGTPPQTIPTTSTLKPPTLDKTTAGRAKQTAAITGTNATVYWVDVVPPATVETGDLWYKVSVRDSFGVLLESAYVASGVQKYNIESDLTPNSTYKITVASVFNPQQKIYTNVQEVVSKDLSISVKTPAFTPVKVTTAKAEYTSNTISLIDKTYALNSATNNPNKYYYLEYTHVTNTSGQPDWNSAFVEDLSSVTSVPTNSSGTVVTNYRLKQSLTPGTQYYVRVVTLNYPFRSPTGLSASQVAYSTTVKFKTAALPLPTITKSGFSITDNFQFGIDFKGKTLEQAAKDKKLNITSIFSGINYSYELLVSTGTTVDKGTGLLNGAVSMPTTIETNTNEFSALPVPLGGEEGIFKKLGINSGSLGAFKSLGFQLKITVNYLYKSTTSDPGTPTSFDIYTKPVKLTMPKWFID
ncbi:MAG: fibronectin type III domain-containing protein [Planctomycetaceae bacterium]|jgi:hypothetical protein|nr:fibronectin type III domain-containing protein [Planctomycetaceae bacterium]